MKLFGPDIDLSEMNYLTPEEKVLVVKIKNMIEEINEKLHRRGTDVSLPYRLQLKSDIGEIERTIKKFKKGKDNSKVSRKLELLYIEVFTEAENIFK